MCRTNDAEIRVYVTSREGLEQVEWAVYASIEGNSPVLVNEGSSLGWQSLSVALSSNVRHALREIEQAVVPMC